jgi:hypothetical protein
MMNNKPSAVTNEDEEREVDYDDIQSSGETWEEAGRRNSFFLRYNLLISENRDGSCFLGFLNIFLRLRILVF